MRAISTPSTIQMLEYVALQTKMKSSLLSLHNYLDIRAEECYKLVTL